MNGSNSRDTKHARGCRRWLGAPLIHEVLTPFSELSDDWICRGGNLLRVAHKVANGLISPLYQGGLVHRLFRLLVIK